MATQVNLGIGVVDNTQSGLSSAERNISRFSKKSIKQLELEAKVSFPSIAGQIDGLEKNFSALKRKLGKFQFSGMRVGKKGNILGDMLFDAREIRGNLSTDVTKGLLDNLKAIQKGLSTGSVKSNNILGIDTAKEIKKINELIAALETYNKQMKVIERAWGAQDTAKIQAEKRKAYSAEFEEARKQKKDDELFRRRWAHEFGQWNKNDAELARLQREADKRSKNARIEYDRQIESKKDSRNADLDLLREMYKRGDSMFVNGSRPIQATKNLNDQLESLKKQKEENEKILAVVGSKTKADKAYRKQIEGENEVIKKQILLLEQAKKQIEYISNPPKGQFQSYINRLTSEPVDSDMEGLKAKLREEERVSAKRAKAEAEADKEVERQFKSRVKAKRNAADIEVAIDNERVARERANSASAQTNAKRTERTLRDEIKALRELKSAEDALDRAQGKRARNARKNSQTNQRIRSLEQEANAIRRVAQEQAKANRTNAQLEKQYKSQGQLLGRLSSLASRYFSVYTIARFANSVAQTTGFFQQQQVALEGIIGSASKARVIFNDIQSFALQSPFQTKELVDFTKKLSAFGIEPDKLFPTVKELADISTGLGVDMGRIILAYGQVKSASVLRGQELRQFTEAGIPMVQALADKFTKMNGELVTTADIFEMISKRQVSFEVVADVLSDMTAEGGRFYKMQENVTNTLYGQIQKLKDLWTLALKDIGNSAGGFLNGVVSLLQKVVSNTKMVGAALAAAFVGNWIGKNIYGIVRIMTHLKSYIRLLRIAATLNKSAFIGFGLGAALAVGVGAFVKIKDELTKVKRKMQEISDSFTKETNKMIDGVNALIKRMRSATAGSKEWNDALETLKNNYGEYLDVNDAVLQKVIQGIDLNKEEKKSFDDLSESIAAAIKLKKEYEELTAKKNEAENLMSTEFAGMFKRYSKSLVSQIGDYGDLNKFFGTNYDKAIKPQISSRVEAIFKSALDAFTSYGKTSFEDFKTIFKTMLNNEFIGSDLKGNSAGTIIDAYLKTAFSSISNSSVFAEYLNVVGKLSGEGSSLFDSMVRINRLFEDNKFSPMENTPLGIHKEREEFYRDIFGKGLSKELEAIVNQEGTKESKKALIELMAVVADTKKGTYDVYAAFDNLLNAVGDPERRRVIADAANLYKKHTDALTDDEMAIAKNLESVTEFSNSVVQLDRKNKFKTQEYFEKWNPSVKGDQTIEQTREEISTEYQSLKKELDTYLSKDAEIFANEIKVIQEKMKVLEKIAGSSFYNVDLTDDKKSGGNKYERIRITNFFDDLLSLVTKAEDEMKKITGVTGYTNELGNFVDSLSADNFLKAFFTEGGNPFEKILAKMTEYGITDFLPNFDQTTLKNIFRDAGWEEGKPLSIPDFKAIYERVIRVVGDQVLEGLKARRDSYAVGSSERNSLDSAIKSLQEQQSKSIKEMETRWGADEIGNKIESAVKELASINSNLDKIKNEREIYSRITNAGVYTDARKSIGWDTESFSSQIASSIAMMLKGAGSGLANTNAGAKLSTLVNSGKLGIGSLSALLDIAKELEDQAAAIDPKTAGQFKDVVKTIVDSVKNLVESIIKDYEEWNKYITVDKSISNHIQNSSDRRDNAFNILSSAVSNGDITDAEKGIMILKLLQDEYNSLLSKFGGSELPKWVTRLYADGNSPTGISKAGMRMANIFGDTDLTNMVIRALDQKYRAGGFGEVGSEAAIDNFTKAVLDAVESLSKMNAIVDKVDRAVQHSVDAAKSALSAIDATTSKLGLRKGSNGKLYDKDGNLNLGEKYYQLENRKNTAGQVIDLIGNFSGNASGVFKSIMSGDIFGAISSGIKLISDLISNIIGIGDSSIQAKQDELIRSNDKLANAMNSLEHSLKTAAGNEKYDIYFEKASSLRQQQALYEELLYLENLKKEGDADKAADYAKQAEEAGKALEDLQNDFKSEILSTADEIANTLTDALVGAFREGTNAARSWRDAVKEYIGDVLKQELMTKIISPRIDDIMSSFFGSEELTSDQVKELFSDEGKVLDFVDALNTEGTNLVDIFNALPQELKDLIAFNSNTSALSGGISGITEDTARTLEGLANSMLMQMILTNRELSTISQSGFAQVQVSWFNDMLQQARATRTASEQIKQILDETRSGIRPLKVEVM